MSTTPRTDAAADYTAPEKMHKVCAELETELNENAILYQGLVAEMNDRLIERQRTLLEKGMECEEMRKALERERAEMRTARELLNLAAKQLREANKDADRLAKLVEDGPGWSLTEWDSSAREVLAAHKARKTPATTTL
jgi:hypothetical protein